MGSKWKYNCCFVGCRFQILFKIYRAFKFSLKFLFQHFFKVYVVQPSRSTGSATAWKIFRFLLKFLFHSEIERCKIYPQIVCSVMTLKLIRQVLHRRGVTKRILTDHRGLSFGNRKLNKLSLLGSFFCCSDK